ncbi:conserved protein of unknown function (plasmid) [Rhodovastum atsumiense]|uniref:Uncharacterized protein n=1 Tax=Rhodovastum atsumiense TaxID=504468 RepID=A0A5M6ITK7_9PROT|nr:hypothetical protein [Rhodovastum atsumiense]KAA5611644.1 hypothetical protein F1189_13875 [Rhodovastum atsumiense]CAH2606258.1 conserved protein of unknown function [Rhodovastum atsumiense]
MADLPELRRAIREARAAKKEARRQSTERRVYNLPSATVAGVLGHQLRQDLPSETAAVRELLDAALSSRGFPR